MLDRTEYSTRHVNALIRNYYTFRARADTDPAGMNFLVQLADLDRVLALIPRGYREVVLLHGLLGLPQRTVAGLLNRGQSSVSSRYESAVVEITYQLNRRFPDSHT